VEGGRSAPNAILKKNPPPSLVSLLLKGSKKLKTALQ
jgi:hypothetical protein